MQIFNLKPINTKSEVPNSKPEALNPRQSPGVSAWTSPIPPAVAFALIMLGLVAIMIGVWKVHAIESRLLRIHSEERGWPDSKRHKIVILGLSV